MLNKLEPIKQTIETMMFYNKDRVEVECPMCHDTQWEYLDDIRRPIIDSHLCICKNCGFISFNPQLKDIQQWYIKQPRPQDLGFLSTKATKLEKHRLLIMRYLSEQKRSLTSVLDYGCSDGYLIKALQDEGYAKEVKGIEPNPGHANWAKHVYGLNVTTDYSLSQYPDQSEDLIICYHVLEHIQKPDELIKEFRRILKDDGLLYIGLPTLSRLDYPTVEVLFKDEHINWWTDDTLAYFLEKQGFKVTYMNNNLYGTAVIVTKYPPLVESTNFYEDNMQLLYKIRNCYAGRDKIEKAMSQGDMNAARKASLEALGFVNDFPELIIKYASLFDPLDEQDILEEYTKKKPNFYELYIALGMSYFKDSELDKAEKALTKALEIGGFNALALVNLGQIHYYKGDFLKSIEYLKKLYELEPYNQPAFEILATILLRM